jgi:hypothetical protein
VVSSQRLQFDLSGDQAGESFYVEPSSVLRTPHGVAVVGHPVYLDSRSTPFTSGEKGGAELGVVLDATLGTARLLVISDSVGGLGAARLGQRGDTLVVAWPT